MSMLLECKQLRLQAMMADTILDPGHYSLPKAVIFRNEHVMGMPAALTAGRRLQTPMSGRPGESCGSRL